MKQRRQPFSERHRRFAFKDRHQFAVPPHVWRAILQGLTRPAACGIEIVASKQRSATSAEVMTLSRIQDRCAAGTGALEMREEHVEVTDCIALQPSSPSWSPALFKLSRSFPAS